MGEIKTPQCDKLAAAKEARDAVIEFLDWARGEGMLLGRYQHLDGFRDEMFIPIPTPDDSLVMRFLGIDEQALEVERRALLRRIGGDL